MMKLVDNLLDSRVKRVELQSAISILEHDGLDESRHKFPFGSAGGDGQATHDESRSQVGEVDLPQVIKAPVKVKFDNLG
jgi:hypothetical protein